MTEVNNITELPLDILVLIFPYLDAKSFLAFCSTCKAFQQPLIRLDPAYWSFKTRSVFRVPNQPVVQHDGLRWQKMYRRLFTQTRVYTWGNNSHNRLGHASEEGNNRTSLPREFEGARDDLGIIADVQCGGWSTTILNSSGTLYFVGVVDGERQFSGSNVYPQPLRFPNGFPESPATSAYDEPTIKICQFSAGRSHILGLSDSGRIWSWDSEKPAVQIKFANIDLKEDSTTGSPIATCLQYGVVKQVIAGWSYSSAYVHGIGIVAWEPVRRGLSRRGIRRARSVPRRLQHPRDDDEPDTMLMLENFEIPKTGYRRPKGATRESDQERALGEEVGAVENYIVLEHFVVFVTDIGRVFSSKLNEKNKIDNILELRAFRAESGTSLDVQGSFRRFAIFREGEVIIAEQDYINACWNTRLSDPDQINIEGPKKIPALQHNNVVSIAFGDYHFLALHSTGKITSYGTEVSSRGALGLGSMPDARLRGLIGVTFPDLKLLPHAYTSGRQVWFSQEKANWLDFLTSGGKDAEEAKQRLEMFIDDRTVQGEVSEWIEQEAKAWDEDKGEDGLGSHFALRVSAAGWHSGAVLLVNEELEKKEPTYDWQDKSFPRLKLSDGREMEGSVPFDVWREGRPEWQLDERFW
ncbi:hypothetical protein N0V90_010429 [Kalmusia sp. IMI 367209]|nr:hypothetical protein N0V90_010429 [Kalmusia sp. IMI 367209]